ncbi:sel1 repeat family protein [Allofrancisella guangzhouensis]|uniref:Beta-lactamase n=1 Tax=Allofrancisella guangzhouensis TaxID=594679 RepID=A0A0A8E4K0_9GAMM|nr:SEL1-like repeat protein [Allofrancisella guangzhouensis]AJC49140.1 hypothetical protein SD28_05575 [Allofrancisella guangzhouensis]MBK2026857.1 sel1 repeat family protein [Allofrancisella guangzhouensis]MBK2043607.1 sel1 repeat family protein [Allofrancisella guangzhouensis]MBK2046354.1 sel1 repeat family protein [Allofrancisella guangzhouensis]
MFNKDDSTKVLKKIGSIPLTKKNITIFITIIMFIVVFIIGLNNYFSYKHQVLLEQYSTAIADIQNKNKEGYNQAYKILKRLADSGKATTKDYYYLGYMYQYGLATKKDYFQAYKYYQKAINDNNPEVYYQLAILYKDGQGVSKNNEKAINYFTKAYNLGSAKALDPLIKLLKFNQKLIPELEPKPLFEIYLAYKDGKLLETNNSQKDKFLLAAISKGYEPAVAIQADNFAKNGDSNQALTLWETLLYSSNPKISTLAKTKITQIQDAIQDRNRKEALVKRSLQKKQFNEDLLKQRATQEQIEHKRQIGLSVPKKQIKNLTGLMYLNLSNINQDFLVKFHEDIAGIYFDSNLLAKPANLNITYINKLLKLAKFKNNRSSVWFNLENQSDNRFEGLVYYFYNDKNKYSQDFLNIIIKHKPKSSSLTPNVSTYDLSDFIADTEISGQSNSNTNTEEAKNVQRKSIELSHEEKIQRMQIFAQKGDYKEFYNLEKIAEAGDVYAIYYLGEYYYEDKEYTEALKYFYKAADAGYGKAYYKLATLYYNEEQDGVSYDKEKAIKYYKKAAELGVRNAKNILMLIEPNSIPQ